MICGLESTDDEAILGDTPIGRLHLVDWRDGTSGVCVVDEHDPERIVRIIHTLQPNENPLEAVYGKRTFERAEVLAAYGKADDRRQESQGRWLLEHRKDFRNRLEKILAKDWSGTMRESLSRIVRWT